MDRENIFNKDDSVESSNSVGAVTKRIVRADGNGLKLSLLTLCFLLFAFAFLVLCTLPPLFVDGGGEMLSPIELLVYAVSSFGLAAGIVFLVFPIATGIMCFAKHTVDGDRPYFLTVASPFAKGFYLHTIAVQLIILVRMLLIALPMVGGISYLPFFFENYAETPVFFLVADSAYVICSSVAAMLVGAYFSSFLFFAPYLMVSKKMRVFDAVSESFRMSRKRHGEIIKMTARGVLDLIVSVLSFMVLFVIYAMPRMTVSYFVYCNSVLDGDTNQNK